jgi:hypothetical protein
LCQYGEGFLLVSGSPKMHVILEAFASTAMATLASYGVVVDTEEGWED